MDKESKVKLDEIFDHIKEKLASGDIPALFTDVDSALKHANYCLSERANFETYLQIDRESKQFELAFKSLFLAMMNDHVQHIDDIFIKIKEMFESMKSNLDDTINQYKESAKDRQKH